MYNLPHFKVQDADKVKAFMQAHPFALLTGVDAQQRPVATQVPLLMREREGKLFLLGHIQRKTDHCKAFEQNPQALVMFTGPHAYVSASWYTNPQMASTWNYMAVHVRGHLRFLDDQALFRLLEELTAHFENNPASPAQVSQMPKEYMEAMMKAIVAFEIEVSALDHVFKLSQNRDQKDYERIIRELKAQGGESGLVAAEMERLKTS
jgi:transcriptional regulator